MIQNICEEIEYVMLSSWGIVSFSSLLKYGYALLFFTNILFFSLRLKTNLS